MVFAAPALTGEAPATLLPQQASLQLPVTSAASGAAETSLLRPHQESDDAPQSSGIP